MDDSGSCPWSGWDPAVLSFCERNVCAWIKQPANTWSNLAYIAVGIWVLRLAWRHATLRWFGILGVLVGLTSFFYHASATWFGEILDIGSMVLLSNLVLTLNLRRSGRISRHWLAFYLLMNVLSLALLVAFKGLGIWVFTAEIFASTFFELGMMLQARRDRTKRAPDYRFLWLTLGFLVASWLIWLTDYHRLLCIPDNHLLTGHAIWHMVNSMCFYFLYRFYALNAWPPAID
jgi:hypothetical protein